MNDFLSADFLKFLIPLVGAVGAWVVNERRKLAWEQYQRKEERYRELIRTLGGFYVATQDSALKQGFLDQVNALWLYCPDDVIRKAYSFLVTVESGANSSDNAKETACGEFINAIRHDLLSRKAFKTSRLDGSEFRHFIAT
jgi:hypothetical protein